jgi:acyl-CoA reductase-like NAD-dependent aldehyde dehydrogenase
MRTLRATAQLDDAPHIIAGVRHSRRTTALIVADAPDAIPAFAVAEATAADIDAAAHATTEGFRLWRRTPGPQRAAVLHRAAAEFALMAEEVAQVLVLETGKPLAQARSEVKRACGALVENANHAATATGLVLDDQSCAVWGVELSEPRGPSLIVSPWNMPVQLAAIKVGGALAAGCSVVIKPSPFAPASVDYLHAAFERAQLPTGCLSVIQGGSQTVKKLVEHPAIKIVSLTGNDTTGREIMSIAARAPKKVILELGGKSANIVLADADLDAATRGIIAGFVRNQGAACTTASRVLVAAEVVDEVTERVLDAAGAVVVGDPYDDVDMGAIRHKALYDHLQECLTRVAERGGKVIGGEPVGVPGRTGYFMRPAVILNLSNDDPIARNELFGPIAAIIPVSGVDEAVRISNDSHFGLAAGIWSRDLPTLQHVWEELEVGTVYVNSYNRIDGIPLATEGRGASGFGVENGAAGVAEFRCTKSVHLPRLFP